MSYSPSEALTDQERHIEFLRVLAEKYPDAYRDDAGRWRARLTREEMTDFEVIAGPQRNTIRGPLVVECLPYAELGGGRVYADAYFVRYLQLVLIDVKHDNPEAYAALVAAVKK